MPEILTVTLNPAVDLSTGVEHVVAGPKLRCNAPRIDPGGGGINVARVIKRLGGQSLALVAVGGPTGQQLLSLLQDEDLSVQAIPVSGATRHSLEVTDESNGAQYRFIFPGEVVTPAEVDLFFRKIIALSSDHPFVVVSGSMPPGLPEEFLGDVAAALEARTCQLCVDTSGPALERLISSPGIPLGLLRLDQPEAQKLAKHALASPGESAAFARTLIRKGVAGTVVLGLGPKGSVLVTRDGAYFCTAPDVPVISKTGAGDSFLAALVLSLARGEDPATALRWGSAASSAAVMTEGTRLCDKETVERLFVHCHVSAIED